MHLILVLYVAAGFVLLQLVRFLYKTLSSPLRDIPGPFLARFTDLWYLSQVRAEEFQKVNIELHQKHGSIVRLGPNLYSIAAPDKTVYGIGSKFPKSQWYDGFKHPSPDRWTIFADRDIKRHAETRKRFQNIYSMSSLVTYETYVDNCTDIFSRRLSEFAEEKNTFDMGHWLICYAFDVIGEITYSKRFGFLDAGDDVGGLLHALRNNLVYSVLVGVVVWLHPYLYTIMQYVPNSGAHGKEYLFGTVSNRIGERVKERAAVQAVGAEKKRIGDEEGMPKDFLDKISDSRDSNPEKVTPYHIFMMILANIVAGSDTTGITLSAIFYHLLRNPDAMKKLRDEIDLATAEGRAGADHVRFAESQKLPYLQAVLKESMRMHAAVGLPLWRDVPEGGAEICGRFFPGGTTVGFNSWVGHYDAEVFGPDVAEFRPERWIEAEKEDGEKFKRMETYYTPFGLGSRTCLGRHISILEISKLIPQLVKRFDFELEYPDKPWKTSNYWFVKPVDFTVKVSRRVEAQ